MRTAVRFVLVFVLALAVAAAAGPAAFAATPEPVSPAGFVGQRCPTFSWSAVPDATGYELVVYGASEHAEEDPFVSVRLPAGAAVWTPAGPDCLAPGNRYAWVLRTVGPEGDAEEGTGWSEPALFEVAPAPSREEVETAVASLRRLLRSRRSTHGGDARATQGAASSGGASPTDELARDWRQRTRSHPESEPQNATPAAAPSLGAPSLTLDGNVAGGAATDVFKDGAVFLWDDTTGNTAFGRRALRTVAGDATNNTAVGWETLEHTEPGASPTDGSQSTVAGFRVMTNNTTGSGVTATGSGAAYLNTSGGDLTMVGSRALFSNTTGVNNTAHGAYGLYANTEGTDNTTTGDLTLVANTTGSNNTGEGSFALFANTIGSNNSAIGIAALQDTTEGARNVAIGYSAGLNATTGNDNIFILSYGTASDTGTIRVGTAGKQNAAFVAGSRGTTTGVADAVTVVIDSAGQLGTVSSSRELKQDIRDVGTLSRRLLDLRPVSFRYREHAASKEEGHRGAPLQFGLVAEEVAEVFPELVVRDGEGRPETVKYRLLSPLLLNELQRLHGELADRRRRIEMLRDRLRRLEQEPPPARRAFALPRPSWQPRGGPPGAPE